MRKLTKKVTNDRNVRTNPSKTPKKSLKSLFLTKKYNKMLYFCTHKSVKKILKSDENVKYLTEIAHFVRTFNHLYAQICTHIVRTFLYAHFIFHAV